MNNPVIDPYNRPQAQPQSQPVQPLWVDVRDRNALNHMEKLRADAAAALQRMVATPPPPDPLVQAQQRIAELEAEVKRLTAELEAERTQSSVSPHLKRIERRA